MSTDFQELINLMLLKSLENQYDKWLNLIYIYKPESQKNHFP